MRVGVDVGACWSWMNGEQLTYVVTYSRATRLGLNDKVKVNVVLESLTASISRGSWYTAQLPSNCCAKVGVFEVEMIMALERNGPKSRRRPRGPRGSSGL